MGKEFTDVEAFLRMHFLKRIKEDLEHPRADAIHVSSLVYGCPRRVYFDWKFTNYQGVYSSYDEQSLANFWIGSKIHELPMSNVVITEFGRYEVIDNLNEFDIVPRFMNVGKWKLRYVALMKNGKEYGKFGHELPVWDEEYNIVGTLDELVYDPNSDMLILIDKKTANNIPTKPYDHHIKQVYMYLDLIEKNWGIRPNAGSIFYIKKVGEKNWEIMFRPYQISLKNLRKEISQMYELAKEVMDADTIGYIPRPKPSWLCSKCPFYQLCIDLGYEKKQIDTEKLKKRKDSLMMWIKA